MTLQEAFDKVLFGLRAQAVGSFDYSGVGMAPSCLYRNKTGLKCAIGQLIPDDEYVPEMEALLFLAIKDPQHPAHCKTLSKVPVFFLRDLMSIHDMFMPQRKGDSMLRWEDQMRETAGRYGLHYTQILPE